MDDSLWFRQQSLLSAGFVDRFEAMQQTITSDRAMLLVVALVDAVRRHVSERKVLNASGREVERLVAVAGNVLELS